MLSLALGLSLATAQPGTRSELPVSGEEARRAAEPLIAQMFGEAEQLSYGPDSRGWPHFSFSTRPRASSQGGICERERVRIEMEMPPHGDARARIRNVEVERYFRVVADEARAPLWELRNEALESACLVRDDGQRVWSKAASVHDVWPAVVSLIAVKRALAEPDSPLLRWQCWRSSPVAVITRRRIAPQRPPCADRAAMAARIDPLYPGMIMAALPGALCWNNGQSRCQRFQLFDPRLCGYSILEVETDPILPFGLRAATFIEDPRGYYRCTYNED